ncbi:hypothetical protein BX600DRAFT_90602 [Xylariales sp. PMI_506]|nr:hypothetical protein BX600DRAFT_90602 [Xylariales sp. PMI_506]
MQPASQYWKLLARGPEPKPKRSAHQKVRTGCTTCKKRRVKCDERQPFCARCEKGGHECGGYKDLAENSNQEIIRRPARKSAKNSSVQTEPYPIKPLAPAGRPNSLVPLGRNPPVVRLSGRDVSYFDTFQHHVVNDFNAWTRPGFWDRLVMRESIVNNSTRHEVLALAALTRSLELDATESKSISKKLEVGLDPEVNIHPKAVHEWAALNHHSKAIDFSRLSLTDESFVKTTTFVTPILVTTMIFIIFEAIKGNFGAVDGLITHGVSLLRQSSAGRTASQSNIDSERMMMQIMFTRFSLICGLTPFFPGQKKLHLGLPVLSTVPEPPGSASPGAMELAWSRILHPIKVFMVNTSSGYRVHKDQRSEQKKEIDQHIHCLRRWLGLTETYLEQSKNDRERQNLRLTKIQILAVKIYLACVLDTTEMEYDQHVDDFWHLIRTMRQFTTIDQSGFNSRLSFNFDFNIMPWICFAILKCRAREARQFALQTLKDYSLHKAGWGHPAFVRTLQCFINIEEEGRDPAGLISSGHRYRWNATQWEPEHHRGWMCLVPVEAAEGGDLEQPVKLVSVSYT